MNMVLRPNESLVLALGPPGPGQVPRPDRHQGLWAPPRPGRQGLGRHAAERICNGRWEYRPDFTRDIWRKGAEKWRRRPGRRRRAGARGREDRHVVWKMRSPYPFVGGKLDVAGQGGEVLPFLGRLQVAGRGREPGSLFPFSAQRRCPLRLLAQMRAAAGRTAQAASPSSTICRWPRSPFRAWSSARTALLTPIKARGPRKVRITHEWVERSLSRPPAAPPAPIFPA